MGYYRNYACSKILFDGFLRIEILNNLSNEARKIASNDVLNLCHTFFKLEIKSLMDQQLKFLTEDGDNEWLNMPGFESDAKIYFYVNYVKNYVKHKNFGLHIK